MGVKLRIQKNASGKNSLYLDVHHHGRLPKEFLNLFLYDKPKTPQDRLHNNQVKTLAEKARADRELELLYEERNLARPMTGSKQVIQYFEEFQKGYSGEDYRKVDAMLMHLTAFTAIGKEFRTVNENYVADFKKYLQAKVSTASAKSYFAKFRQGMRRANIDRLCKYDIRTFTAKFFVDGTVLKKDVLDEAEIQTLAKTPCENQTIASAFLFCCFTGLDFADVFVLKWTHIKGEYFVKPRQKTEAGRVTPLHPTAKKILSKFDKTTEYIFQELPNRKNRNYSWSACDKTLKAWVKRANIQKHITWHCARHSFATNMEGDEGTIRNLLGHSENSNEVKKYRRIKDERLKRAVASLKAIEI